MLTKAASAYGSRQFRQLGGDAGTPGWSWATVYYHASVSAGAGQQFPRGGRVDVGIAGQADLAFFGPTYVFATPVLGGQAAVSLLGVAGRNEGSAALSLTGPLGNTIALNRTQDLVSYGDVIPQVTLKWNQGVNNYMVYGMGNIPIGDYDSNRLANLGIGTVQSTSAAATPTSIRSPATNSPASSASPTISRTPTRTTRTAPTSISTGAPRISSTSSSSSASSATTSSRSPTTSVRQRRSAASARGSRRRAADRLHLPDG
jgi:hypothetical protein